MAPDKPRADTASSSALASSSSSSASLAALRSGATSSTPPSSPSDGSSDETDEPPAKADAWSDGPVGPLDDERHFPLLIWDELSPWMKWVPPRSELLEARQTDAQLSARARAALPSFAPSRRDFESEFTLVGYRRQQDSVLGCFYSAVGYVHNETVNILTHGLGALYLLPHIYAHLFLPAIYRPSLRWTDTMHFTVRADARPFLRRGPPQLLERAADLGACLRARSARSSCARRPSASACPAATTRCRATRAPSASSGTASTMCVRRPLPVARMLLRADARRAARQQVGIVILIVGSNYPALYYGRCCRNRPASCPLSLTVQELPFRTLRLLL